jgi:hypothetical protein
LKTTLGTFVSRGGKLLDPASESDIAAANAELVAHDCPELPPDYVALLKQANRHHVRRLHALSGEWRAALPRERDDQGEESRAP